MATKTPTRPRSGRKRAPAQKAGRAAAGRATKKASPKASPPKPSKIAGAAAKKTAKFTARKALQAGARAVRSVIEHAGAGTEAAGRNLVEAGLRRRLPIQVAVDVAVPLQIAWSEWMTFDAFTEGVHRIEDVERDGDRLTGRTAAPHSADWEAEIVDLREEQALAWRSETGSDCAGLATFHRLSDRLTRIELDLDVVPTGPVEALALTFHVAHRRAEAELRRFKARVEFINPDVYEAELNGNHAQEDNGPDEGSNDKEES